MAHRRVVATVTLVGLGPGDPVWVDDADPQIARWLRGGQLRALDPEPQPEVEAFTDAVVEVDPQVKVEPVTPKPPRAKKQ
jgi:hypothetical protein